MTDSLSTTGSATPTGSLTGEPDTAPLYVRISNLAAVLIPFLGVIAAAVLLWGQALSWVDLGLLLGMYILSGLGITIGYHRLFTHRSFEAPGAVKATLIALGSMAVEGPLLRWAAQHRRHHQHSDRVGDPHSPHLHGDGILGMLKGLWHAHMGWMFEMHPIGMKKYVPDLLADRLIVTSSNLFSVWVVLGALLPTLVGGLLTMSWMGALLGFLWGGAVRVFLIHHVTFSINSVCHLWGTRPFRSRDHSRNNPIFGVLGFGEGWHNNHHAFPASARHGLRWWEIDLGYWVIRLLAALGLAWNVRVPAGDVMAEKMAR